MIVFVKEAKSIRGISDLLGCKNGIFIALECKRSAEEARKGTGRIALQKKFIDDIRTNGGYAAFVYPENEEQILKELERL